MRRLATRHFRATTREFFERATRIEFAFSASELPLIFGGFQRTSADELSSSGELSEQLRTPANLGKYAKNDPWGETRVRLPNAVLGALENAAATMGISLEILVVRIITQGRGRVADENSGFPE